MKNDYFSRNFEKYAKKDSEYMVFDFDRNID